MQQNFLDQDNFAIVIANQKIETALQVEHKHISTKLTYAAQMHSYSNQLNPYPISQPHHIQGKIKWA